MKNTKENIVNLTPNSPDVSDENRMFLYVWDEESEPNECKLGDHFVLKNKSAYESLTTYVRGSMGRRKDKYDDGSIRFKAYWDVTEWVKKNCPEKFKKHGKADDFVRAKIGYRKGTTGDVHYISTDKMVEEVNGILFGSKKKNTFQPREEQLTAIESAYNHYSNGGDDFLYNCKMRFGKTLTAYWLMKKMKCKTTLILTYKPQVDAEWESSLRDHIDFEDYQFLHAKDFSKDKPIKIPKGKNIVLFASFQDILGKNLNGSVKDKWKYVLKQKYDFLIIDEVHYGASTAKANDIISKLKFYWKLVMSGTPLELLMSNDYNETNSYTWSYIDEQKKRKIEEDSGWKTEVYKWLARLNMYTYELGESVVKDADCYDEKEYLTLNKFFRSEDGKEFVNASAVNRWLDLLCREDERIHASPFNNNKMAGKLNVMFWYLSSIASCKAMKIALENHQYFKQYKIVPAYGDNEGQGKDTLKNVKKDIYQNEKVIILSCGKLNTGVTIPELTTVFMLNDCASAEDYWQTAFRVQSPWKEGNKLECFVVDFNPNRSLTMVYNYADTLAKKDQTIKEIMRETLDVMKVFAYEDNKLVSITADNFDKIIESAINPEKSVSIFESQSLINPLNVNAGIVEVLKNIETTKSKMITNVIVKSILKKGKNFKTLNKMTKGEKQLLNSIRARALTVTKRIPTFQYVSNDKIDCVKSLLKTNDKDEFESIVGVSVKDFSDMIDCEFINYKRLDHAIQAFDYERNKSVDI